MSKWGINAANVEVQCYHNVKPMLCDGYELKVIFKIPEYQYIKIKFSFLESFCL